MIGRHLNGYKLIVEKSSTPVRTKEQLFKVISQYSHGNHTFYVAVNPEFLREGSGLPDFLDSSLLKQPGFRYCGMGR